MQQFRCAISVSPHASCLGAADIGVAFDALDHAKMIKALLGRGAHPYLINAP